MRVRAVGYLGLVGLGGSGWSVRLRMVEMHVAGLVWRGRGGYTFALAGLCMCLCLRLPCKLATIKREGWRGGGKSGVEVGRGNRPRRRALLSFLNFYLCLMGILAIRNAIYDYIYILIFRS